MTDTSFARLQIIECFDRIEHYTRNGHDAFLAEPLIQDAVLWNLRTAAEAAAKLPGSQRPSPEVLQRLTPESLDVNLEAVWRIVTEDLPQLLRKLRPEGTA